jgi:hypothetical protein
MNIVFVFTPLSFSPSLPPPSLSAGIGRTGAFCALSTAIERVKAEGIVDVFHTVKHLRTQRPHMVQTVVSVILSIDAFSILAAILPHSVHGMLNISDRLPYYNNKHCFMIIFVTADNHHFIVIAKYYHI